MNDLSRLSNESEQIKTALTDRLTKRQKELSDKIRQADESGSTSEEIKRIANQEAEKILEQEMNKLLLEKGYSITYKDLESYPQMQDAKQKLNQKVDLIISQYYVDKAAVSNRIAQGLANLPTPAPAPTPTPSSTINPTLQLNNLPSISAGSPGFQNIMTHSLQVRESRRQETIISQQLEQKKTLTSQLSLQVSKLNFNDIDQKVLNLTDPDRDSALVPDYEGWDIIGVIGETNKENETRSTLNGYLLAGYVFSFDGKSSKGDSISDDIMLGNQAKSIKGVKEIYELSDGGHFYKDKAFTMEHLKTDLGLSKYLDEAKKFNPKSAKVHGLIAGLLKHAASIPDNKLSESYTEIIREALSRNNFKEATTEQQQISFIFSDLKSFELYKKSEINRLSFKLLESAIKLYKKVPSFTLDTSKVGGIYSFLTTGNDPVLDNPSFTFEQKFNRIKNLETEMISEFISLIENRNEQYRNAFLTKFSILREKNNNLIRKVVTEDELNEYARKQYSLQSEYLQLNPKSSNKKEQQTYELLATIRGENLKITNINTSLEELTSSRYVEKYYEGEQKIIELIGILDSKIKEADVAISQEE